MSKNQNVYVQKAILNDKPLEQFWFYHKDLVQGGKLILEMVASKNEH